MSAQLAPLANSFTLSGEQLARYERDGYLVLRGLLNDADLGRLDGAIDRHVPADAYAPGKVYPQAAKYTLSQQVLSDPDMAYIAEHPKVLDAVEGVLGRAAHLTAYVVYVRTPGDVGAKMHNDYKRWRPVGSSMDWLFTVIPLTDFDEEHGPLMVAPGSHQLARVTRESARFWERGRPAPPTEGDFVDPGLKRGDVLLMNMYTWHWAPPNAEHRVGVFNKYAAADAPPATGYYVFDDAVHAALTDTGKRILAVHSDLAINTTRAMITYGDELLLHKTPDGLWALPGGDGWEEAAIPGWDHGNRIGALDDLLRAQLDLVLPWVSYVGDYAAEEDAAVPGLCRLYAHPCAQRPLLSDTAKASCKWFTREALSALGEADFAQAFTLDALATWLDAPLRRGKGLSQARCTIDQYAA